MKDKTAIFNIYFFNLKVFFAFIRKRKVTNNLLICYQYERVWFHKIKLKDLYTLSNILIYIHGIISIM